MPNHFHLVVWPKTDGQLSPLHAMAEAERGTSLIMWDSVDGPADDRRGQTKGTSLIIWKA
jgi:hypothetical protein